MNKFKIISKRGILSKTMGIRIPADDFKYIENIAKKNKITPSEVGRQMIEHCLSELGRKNEQAET